MDELLEDLPGGSLDLLVLARAAVPDALDDSIVKRVVGIHCPQVQQLQRALNELLVRVLDEDDFQYFFAVEPLCVFFVGEILGKLVVVVFQLLFCVVLVVLHTAKDVFELSHPADFLLEKLAGKVLLGDDELVCF